MKNLLPLLLLSLVACNSIHKLPGMGKDEPPQSTALPSTYTMTGTTTVDFQIVSAVRTTNSLITVRVKRPGQDWYTCNKYELSVTVGGPGGGSVGFQRQVIVTYAGDGVTPISFFMTGLPVAPTGTEYQITSSLVTP